MRKKVVRANNVWLERQASNIPNIPNTSPQDYYEEDLRPSNTAPSLPVTMLLQSKSMNEITVTHSFRMAYSRINMLSIAMSVLASHVNAIWFHELIQSMETIDDLVRQIDKRESLLQMTHSQLIDTLRMCPLVRFREDRTNVNMSEVSLVELSSLNQYELERWAKRCDGGVKPNLTCDI